MESYDFIDGRLVLRQGVSPLPEAPQYLNVRTGRMVRYGTRTYFQLIEAEYEIVEDYYIINPEESDLIDAVVEETQRRNRRLTFTEISAIRNHIDDEYLADEIQRNEEREQRDQQEIMQRLDQLIGEIRRLRTSDPGAVERFIENLNTHPDSHPSTLEDHAPRLAKLNIVLCSECLMPENPNDLTDGLCKDCNAE
jgi:hypothetical protein